MERVALSRGWVEGAAALAMREARGHLTVNGVLRSVTSTELVLGGDTCRAGASSGFIGISRSAARWRSAARRNELRFRGNAARLAKRTAFEGWLGGLRC